MAKALRSRDYLWGEEAFSLFLDFVALIKNTSLCVRDGKGTAGGLPVADGTPGQPDLP